MKAPSTTAFREGETTFASVLLFALVFLTPLDGAESQEVMAGFDLMPTELSFSETNKSGPTWIALETAFLPSGELRPDEEMPPKMGSILRRTVRTRPSIATGCVELIQTVHETPEGRADLGSALAEAKSTLLATVTGVSPGLWHGLFGTLFRVQIDEVLNDSDARQPTREHYIFAHGGEYRLQNLRVCVQQGEYPKHLPEVGDRVLLLTNWWEPSHPMLSTGGGSGFISLTADGRALVPQRYLHAESTLTNISADDLLNRVLDTLESSR